MRATLREWSALLLLVGTIVGVGMFAIPFVFLQAGFLMGLGELVLLSVAVTLVHLAYTEVVVATPVLHRLPGYLRLYLGPSWGRLAAASYLFGISGALLAYLVLGGFFLDANLHLAFPSLPPGIGLLLFYLLGIFVIFRGVKFEGFANAIFTAILIIAIFVVSALLLPKLAPIPLKNFHFDQLFIPYGVILFSMTGAAVIPDMRRLLGGREDNRIFKIVILGTMIPAVLYLLFAVAVAGATGLATTPDAISGLAARFGTHYFIIGSIIGFLATITSFITLGSALEGMLVTDMGLNERMASMTIAFLPAAFYFLGFNDFIAVVSVVGALAIGLDSILILILHQRVTTQASPNQRFRVAIPRIVRFVLIIIFAAGIVRELAEFF